MIYSRKHGFLICTPTKCGTEALRSALTRRSEIAEHLLPKHRADVPSEIKPEEILKIMTVRNPWHRLVSMFYYLRNHNNGWGKGNYDPNSFLSFLTYHQSMVVQKPCVDWTWNLCQIFDKFEPDVLWKNEKLNLCYERFIADYKIKGAAKSLTRVNVSKKDNPDHDSHYDRRMLRLVADWCEPDADRFKYRAPKV